MTVENPPFEDVFTIENGDFPNVMLVFRGVSIQIPPKKSEKNQGNSEWKKGPPLEVQSTF